MCDILPRSGGREEDACAASQGLALIDVLPTFYWFLAERICTRSRILPTDPPERAMRIMLFVGKRIVRVTPISQQGNIAG